MADRPFVRVYHADMIRDYPEIWDDDAALAAWLRLLVIADGAWPAPASLPRSAKARGLKPLTDGGLVLMSGTHRYSIKGLDSERTERANAARNAAAKRWQSGRNAGASDTPMPSRAEPSQSEPNRASPPTARAGEDKDQAVAYWELTGRFPTDKTLGWLDDLALRFGSEAVVKALANCHIANPSVKDLLGRTQDRLRAEARELDRKERDAEQVRLQEKRAKPPALEEWREEYRRHLEQEYGDAA